MSNDVASEARAIEEPVAAKRAWGPVLRGEARARLARYDAAVKRDALYAWLFPPHPVGQRPTDEQRTPAERAGLALVRAASARARELTWPCEGARGLVAREVAQGIEAMEAA